MTIMPQSFIWTDNFNEPFLETATIPDYLIIIDSTAGIVSLSGLIDYEVMHSISFTIVVTDSGGSTAQGSCSIYITDVNDNSPSFSAEKYVIQVSEAAETFTTLAVTGVNYANVNLSARDADSGVNSFIYFYISNISVHYVSHALFLIPEQTFSIEVPVNLVLFGGGDIATSILDLIGSLDRETISFYSLNLIASDNGVPSRNTQTTIDIIVLDVNDNAPISSLSFLELNVTEDIALGATITNVLFTDADQNPVITYILLSQTCPSFFALFVLR